MSSPMTLTGVPEMLAKLQALKVKAPTAFAAALYQEAQLIATEAIRICPVYVGPTGVRPTPGAKTGYPIPGLLRASIHVEGPFQEGPRIFCLIVAGGAAGAYAARQHEELTWHHEVGQAKYIEGPLLAARPFLAANIAARVDLGKAAA